MLTGQQGDVMKESVECAKTIAWNVVPEKYRKDGICLSSRSRRSDQRAPRYLPGPQCDNRVEDDRPGAVPGIVWSRRLNVLSFPVSLHYHGTSSSNCATSSE